MIKHILFILFLLTFKSNFYSQDSIFNPKKKFELSINYALQRPFYSVTEPSDILTVKHQKRYRSRIGIGLRYNVFNRWFTEFQTAFSQEGGGYKQQYTNTNYWKNSLYVGFCSNHKRKIIFEIYTGVDLSILLNSKLKNTVTNTTENVSNYYKNIVPGFTLLGTGIKVKTTKNIFVKVQSYLNITNYKISSEPNIKVAQLILPAFQISLTTFLN